MKTNQINQLIKYIVEESLDMLEAHEAGEWWIDNGGRVQPHGEEGRTDDDLMQNEKWKKMSATKDKITVTTWDLRAEDLRIILKGIEGIMGAEKTEEDPDAVVGKDGYTGPRVDLHLKNKKKSFKNVPIAILQRCHPSNVKNYETGKNPDLAGPVNEAKSFHHLHKEYRLYEADNHIVAIFEDNSRLVFEVHYHDKRGEDKEKWRRRAFSKWKTLANEIHRESDTLNEAGNPTTKSWKDCFKEALAHPELEEFIRNPTKHQRVYPSVDSVNFTPRV
jgi:hypothetical protein